MTVSAPQLAGQEAFVTVSAVDVGILNITRFPVPDAAEHFFAQRRLGVDAYDVYGRVIESFEGGTAKIRFGGDMAPAGAAAGAASDLARADRRPVRRPGEARCQGPRPGEAARCPTSTARCASRRWCIRAARYGSKDNETMVRAPVLAEASLPRVLAPGDRSNVTLDVQNFTGKAGEFKVQVDGIGPLSLADGARTAKLAVEGKTTLTFPLVAREGYTTAQVRVRVEGNGFKVDRQYDVPVRPAWPQVMRARTQVLDALGAGAARSPTWPTG